MPVPTRSFGYEGRCRVTEFFLVIWPFAAGALAVAELAGWLDSLHDF